EIEDVDRARQGEGRGGNRGQSCFQPTSSRGLTLEGGGAVFLNPGLFPAGLSQPILNCGAQAELIGLAEREEAEGLLRPGNRRQHFGWGEYRSGLGQEHQANAGTAVEKLR